MSIHAVHAAQPTDSVQVFSTDDAIACLALWRCPRVGPTTYRRVLSALTCPASFLDPSRLVDLPACLPSEALAVLQNERKRAELIAAAEADWLWGQKAGRCVLFEHDAAYPDALKPFSDSPPILFAVGDVTVLALPQVAVVGTRQPTRVGQSNADFFVRGLVEHGFAITSGLALGVDGVAHESALAAQGRTVAVLGHGLDRVYPKEHTDLARRMMEAGSVLVSEFPLGVAPHRKNFPRRNRIMCGLSSGVLVVEAALKSGSLITARIAADQGKDVFAVPGVITNLMARGCHQLIRDGATLVETVADVLCILAPKLQQELLLSDVTPAQASCGESNETPLTTTEVRSEPPPLVTTLNPLERTVYEALASTPVAMDQLVVRTQLSSQELLTQLMLLELKDVVRTVPGGYQRAR